MKKDIVAFDVETTGLNPQKDYIIQLVLRKIDPEDYHVVDSRNWYINPEGEYEISQQAFEKHGLTKDFLKDKGVKLKDIASDIIQFFDDCDVLTYNGNSFDVNFLYTDLKKIGYDFNIEGRTFYDTFLMYKKLYPSTLEAVYKRYTGKELEGAHDAFNDVNATIDVFKYLHLDGLTREDMNTMDENKIFSPERSIIIKPNENDKIIVFANGKHKDEEFMKICKQDPNYIKWFVDNVASEYTKQVLREYYRLHRK